MIVNYYQCVCTDTSHINIKNSSNNKIVLKNLLNNWQIRIYY